MRTYINKIIFYLFLICLIYLVLYVVILIVSMNIVLFNPYAEIIARIFLITLFMSYVKAIVKKVKRKLKIKF